MDAPDCLALALRARGPTQLAGVVVLLEPDPPDEPFMCGHWVLLPEEAPPDGGLADDELPGDGAGVVVVPEEAVRPPDELEAGEVDVVCTVPVVAASDAVSAPAASPTPMAPPVRAKVMAILLGLRFMRSPFIRSAVASRSPTVMASARFMTPGRAGSQR